MSTKNKLGAGILAFMLIMASAAFYRSSRDNQSTRAHPSGNLGEVVFASPGRVEGLSDTIEVGAGADGVLKAIYVSEHQFVKKGALLGQIACDDLNAMLQTSLAEADAARQARTRLLRGAREEEKRIAANKTAAAQATLTEAKIRLDRQRALYEGGEISRAAYDQTSRDFGVAQADFQASVRAEELLAAPPLEEEQARADADVLAAEGRVRTAQERIRKCAIVAPIDATVLRVFARPGESFSTVMPRPLFSLADASGRRVKAEIDERDLSKVVIGQRVIIQSEGLGTKKLTGTVESISAVMGRKSVYRDDPSDKIDRDVLEAVIAIPTEDAKSLPIGLRVTVQFLSSRQPKL